VGDVTSVAVLDPHPVVRAGVESMVRAQRDLTLAGSVGNARELWPLLYRARPDVLLVDHDPRRGGRLALCMRVKSRLLAPRVVICAAEPTTDLIVPAAMAGADAVVDKAGDLLELLDAIRGAARGDATLPAITPRLQAQAAARLGMQDRAIFAMTLSGTSRTETAGVVGLSAPELELRLAAIIATLSTSDPRPEALAA
jgi:DNA-binding NarL/FixJ family response regulator